MAGRAQILVVPHLARMASCSAAVIYADARRRALTLPAA
jgi:hypothetical protein